MDYSITEIQEKMRDKLPQKRFVHSLGVEYTAASLAMSHGCGIEQAALAGILHDCAKYMSDEKLLEKCKKYRIPISKMEQEHSYLLHAKLGAYYAEHKYRVTDPAVLSAITYHTTGRAGMSLLEKIVFTADYIEPGRTSILGLSHIRKIAFSNMDQAVSLILKNTLAYLKDSKRTAVDTTTIEAYEYYKNIKQFL